MGPCVILFADSVAACPEDEECLAYIYAVDRSRDFCFSLARFTDPEQDEGTIEVMVLDQILAKTKDMSVTLEPARIIALLDKETASHLLGEQEFIVNFKADADTLNRMTAALKSMFRDRPGLTIAATLPQ